MVSTGEQRFVMYNVSWGVYQALLNDQNRHRVRMTYDRGTLELWRSTSTREWVKKLLGRFVCEVTIELDIPIRSGGSTTLRRERLSRGLEPDECFYIRNEKLVRGRKRLEVEKEIDPPPDLAVEVDITSSSINRMAIYAALGVGEIWCYDRKGLHFFTLDKAGNYLEVPQSANLPMIAPHHIARFLERCGETDENSLLREFRQWVRETFAKDQP